MASNKFLSRTFARLLATGAIAAISISGCSVSSLVPIITENNFDTLSLNPFVEKDFPFISTYLDVRNIGERFSKNNVVARGLIVNLDDSTFVCFDRDLLRWSVAWTGGHLTKSMLPEVSYNDYFDKKNTVPQIAGRPEMANGIYPGWASGKPVFSEIRPEKQRREGFTWGPLPDTLARWQGAYVYGNKVVLSYQVSDTEIYELPGCERRDGKAFFTRMLEIGASQDTLYLNVVELAGGSAGTVRPKTGLVYFGEKKDSVMAVGIKERGTGGNNSVRITGDRYLTAVFPPSDAKRRVTVVLHKGTTSQLDLFYRVLDSTEIEIPQFRKGSTGRWPEKVLTKGKVTPDTSAFVTDLLTLPLPNPWKRNVRVTDLAFLSNEKAVVTTFEGDVWTVEGISDRLEKLSWKRFASGLYEPMSIEVYRGQIYVFGKEGIVRLHDLNSDGEADYYENFSDVMQQSAESYEWAADMVFSEKNNGIILAKGGGVTARPGITTTLTAGFRAGSNHSGVIMKISMDGRKAEVFSTGFRAPYLGVHPRSGIITATDQQGNYVPATPIYRVEKGGFFGVPATGHRNDHPEAERPLTWIPHRIDRSAGSQVWMTSAKMGPLNNELVHFSFGKPGLFRVLIDSTSTTLQGAVAPIHSTYSTPVLKGAIGPADGQLYMAGFNLFGSSSKGISAVQRLRYTGKRSYMPDGFRAGKQGIVISFDSRLASGAAANTSGYRVKRWNYMRTGQYGSGHFRPDGTAGEEILPVLASYISDDKKKVLLLIPDMKESDQMEVLYRLTAEDGTPLDDGIWFSVNHTEDLGPHITDFPGVDLGKLLLSREQIASLIASDPPITRERGKELFENMGCIGCHSAGTETAGMYGPPFKGLYGSERKMTDGSTAVADDAYLTESILEPEKRIVKGYEAEMPSFRGVLTSPDIEALLLYIMYLKY